MGTVGHVSDIGGTKDSLHAREIYEEGFQIPPMKLFEAGKPNETLFRLLGENVRNPEQVLGDVHALRRRERDRRRAPARLHGRVRHARSERARERGAGPVRARHARRDHAPFPTASITSEISNNPLGEPLRYPLKLTVKGDADRARLRRRAAAAAAGRPELHAELHRGARDLSAEMHADAVGARQRRLLSRPSRVEGAGRLDPELQAARGGQPAHAHRLVPRAEHLPRAERRGARSGAGLHRACRSR